MRENCIQAHPWEFQWFYILKMRCLVHEHEPTMGTGLSRQDHLLLAWFRSHSPIVYRSNRVLWILSEERMISRRIRSPTVILSQIKIVSILWKISEKNQNISLSSPTNLGFHNCLKRIHQGHAQLSLRTIYCSAKLTGGEFCCAHGVAFQKYSRCAGLFGMYRLHR